jgi:hypothetical protein
MAVSLRCSVCGRTDVLTCDDLRSAWRPGPDGMICPRCAAFPGAAAADKNRFLSEPDEDDDTTNDDDERKKSET